MTERLFCRDKLRKFLQALLRAPEPERFVGVVRQETFPPLMPLDVFLGEHLAKTYYDTLNEVIRELVPQHAEQNALAQAFWQLSGEVATNPDGYHIRGRLRTRLDEFIQVWKKPLKLYEVAYLIKNLNLGTESFSFGRIRFLNMDDSQMANWGISRNEYKKFADKPVVTTQVEATDEGRAFETGLRDVFFGIDLIRLAGVTSLISRLDDEMFLWGLEGEYIVRQVNQLDTHPFWGWNRTFRPLIVDIGEHIKKGLEPEYSNLQAIANEELPEEIISHLKRASSWISSSITRERLDDKIVDLCTALEVMLLPNYTEGKKGQLIDLRHHLIGGNWAPGGILRLYELRSKIVHGSALYISRYMDYWYLLHICLGTLRLVTKLAKRHSEVQTLKELIKTVEKRESLEDFIHFFRMGIFRGRRARSVLQMAKIRLKELEEN